MIAEFAKYLGYVVFLQIIVTIALILAGGILKHIAGWDNIRLTAPIKIRIKFKWQDIWIGAYYEGYKEGFCSIYICIIPMLPIRIWWY